VIREEPGKQKPRSALFASRPRDCGRGNSPEAAPRQEAGGKGKMYRNSSLGRGNGQATPQREGKLCLHGVADYMISGRDTDRHAPTHRSR
jgi:hypothetical protein